VENGSGVPLKRSQGKRKKGKTSPKEKRKNLNNGAESSVQNSRQGGNSSRVINTLRSKKTKGKKNNRTKRSNDSPEQRYYQRPKKTTTGARPTRGKGGKFGKGQDRLYRSGRKKGGLTRPAVGCRNGEKRGTPQGFRRVCGKKRRVRKGERDGEGVTKKGGGLFTRERPAQGVKTDWPGM